MVFKLFWIIRGLLYKPFFGSFGLPSYIGKPVFIGNFKKIFIAKRVRIFPGIRMECIGQNSKIIIKENVSIGHNLHLTAGCILEIGANSTISANVLITDISHEYQEIDKHIMEQSLIIRKTLIGENCFIGYGAVLDAGTILGKQCIVGSNAVLKGEYADYSVIAGIPAKVIKHYNHETKVWEKVNEK